MNSEVTIIGRDSLIRFTPIRVLNKGYLGDVLGHDPIDDYFYNREYHIKIFANYVNGQIYLTMRDYDNYEITVKDANRIVAGILLFSDKDEASNERI